MDRGLVERARDGDREAYELLIHHVGRSLFRVAHRILRDLDVAGDVPPGIHVSKADGTQESVVSTSGLPAGGASFTPAGDRIVFFQRSPEGIDADIVSIGVDGTDAITIVGGPTNDWMPSIAPDGSLIAFIRTTAPAVTDCCGSHTADVYVVAIDGKVPRQVGSGVGDWGGLGWSPDGSRLVTFNLASDKIVVLGLDPEVDPVMIPIRESVGGLSWQALR